MVTVQWGLRPQAGLGPPRIGSTGARPGALRNAGFTLVEVLAASVLLSTAITATIFLFGVGYRAAAASELATRAAALLRLELERPHAVYFEDVSPQARSNSVDDVRFDVEVLVSDPRTGGAVTPATRIKQVQVRLYWTGPQGQSLSLTGTTLVSRRKDV